MKQTVCFLMACLILISASIALAQERVAVVPLGGNKLPSPVAKTGQTLCFNDDGDPAIP